MYDWEAGGEGECCCCGGYTQVSGWLEVSRRAGGTEGAARDVGQYGRHRRLGGPAQGGLKGERLLCFLFAQSHLENKSHGQLKAELNQQRCARAAEIARKQRAVNPNERGSPQPASSHRSSTKPRPLPACLPACLLSPLHWKETV